MRIKTFCKFIEDRHLKLYTLQNCTVVIDAANFLYGLYKSSGLPYVFGCESDKFAHYVRKYLGMFKKANVKCYFIFNGGNEDPRKSLNKVRDVLVGRYFDFDKEDDKIVEPIFKNDIYKEILDEMNFDYTTCQYECVKECIAAAQKLKCPVISYNIDFYFSGIPYIMHSTIQFDEQNNLIKCKIFSLDEFMEKYGLTEDQLAIFTALTDIREFPENHFLGFVKTLKIRIPNYERNVGLLKWLGRTTRDDALKQIFKNINQGDKEKFHEVVRKHREIIRKQETPGIPTKYLENGNKIEITMNDQLWFEKGVASKYIASPLVNLGRSGMIGGTWAIADYTENDAMILSMDVIKYTYNLLTNFEKEEFIFFDNKQEVPVPTINSIQKPIYNASCNPFKNGWDNLNGEFFEHFLSEALQGFDLNELNILPEDSKILMIALIYFSEKKRVSTRNEVCCVLLSYVVLSVLAEVEQNNNAVMEPKPSTSGKGVADKNSISEADKVMAKLRLAVYLASVGIEEARAIWDLKLLHPLVEFQHCLQFLNYLNVLCGKLFNPTIYSKTYNATFVYKVLYTIVTEFNGNYMEFLRETLHPAPTVLAYIHRLIGVYDKIVDNM